MRIVTVRRISQVFFLVLFLWFTLVTTFGERWHELRGWPVNWLLELDPLVGLGTVLTTGTLYAGLLWAVATLVLTAVLGRFFCGWLCPFGTLHQFFGWLGRLLGTRHARNRYNSPNCISPRSTRRRGRRRRKRGYSHSPALAQAAEETQGQ